jgi:hypothetical protein
MLVRTRPQWAVKLKEDTRGISCLLAALDEVGHWGVRRIGQGLHCFVLAYTLLLPPYTAR